MSAQFFSSLADNALLVAAMRVALRRLAGTLPWQVPALTPMFALFYVVLAPFVGAFADAVPKGKRDVLSRTAIKVVGCLMMLFGTPSAVVLCGRGPRRGRLFTGQVRHPDRTAPERRSSSRPTAGSRGSPIAVDHLRHPARRPAGGAGGVGPPVLLGFDLPMFDTGVDTAPEAAIASMILVLYIIAADFQPAHPAHRGPAAAARCTARSRAAARLQPAAMPACGPTSSGQISLATTTLLWGMASATCG